MTHYRPISRQPGENSPGTARVRRPFSQYEADVSEVPTSEDVYPPLYEDDPPTRLPNSTRRYRAIADPRSRQEMNVVIHRRASRPRSTEPVPVVRVRQEAGEETVLPLRRSFWRRFHPKVYVGGAMCLTLALLLGGQTLMSAGRTLHDNWTYEYPRIAQADARVGHDDAVTPTHFLVLNLHRQIYVFECPGGDCSHGHIYPGPVLTGEGTELAPATITVKDVNGDGKPDLVLQVQDSLFVLINDRGIFRPARPMDRVSV